MARELKRATVRIVTNYARLFITVMLGVTMVPIVLGGVGEIGFGLWSLLGATIGLGDMFREIVRSSMNRELGAAYHEPGRPRFPAVYNAAVVVAAMAALAAGAVYVALYWLVHLLNVEPDWIAAARWVIVAQGVYSVVVVTCAPQVNMHLVSERLIWHNLFRSMDRFSYFVGAIVVFWILKPPDPRTGLVWFVFTGSSLAVLFVLLSVANIARLERGLAIRPSLVSWKEVRGVLATSGWNGAMSLALNLHIRLDQIIVNVFFGTVANAAFSVGVRLTAYIRMLAVGMTDGLDVVAARLSSTEDHKTLDSVLRNSTRAHAYVALPPCAVVLALAEPLVHLWVGRHLEPESMSRAVLSSQILVLGFTARGISDGWVRFLYGAGYVRRYAPVILAGGLLNPFLAVALIHALPGEWSFSGPAWSFTAIFLAFHALALPWVGARCLGVPTWHMFRPMLRPTVATALASILLMAMPHVLPPDSPTGLLVNVGAFGATYLALTPFLVLRQHERRRAWSLLRRHLLRAADPSEDKVDQESAMIGPGAVEPPPSGHLRSFRNQRIVDRE